MYVPTKIRGQFTNLRRLLARISIRPLHNLLEPVPLRALPGVPGDEGHQRTDPEEVQETGVDLAGGVQAAGSNQTPDDRGRVYRSALRAGESIGLVVCADLVNVTEHPLWEMLVTALYNVRVTYACDADLRQSSQNLAEISQSNHHVREDSLLRWPAR